MQFAARIIVALLLVASPWFADGPSAHAQASCEGASAMINPGNLVQSERATLCLLSAQRRAHGRARLHVDRLLRAAARRHSREMVRQRFYGHTSPGGETMLDRIRETGYLRGVRSTWVVGENIAWGQGTSATPRAIVRLWMDSPPHRRNILSSSFRGVGIGIVPGNPHGAEGATYTTDFGSRSPARGH
jgi:uncharacterized protein YkwD